MSLRTGRRVKEGDLYTVIVAGKTGLTKVIYVSKVFKNVVLLKLFARDFSRDATPYVDAANFDFKLLYTSKSILKKAHWAFISKKAHWAFIRNEEVTAHERELSKRSVGSEVWIEDRLVGPATYDDLERLPQMRVKGFKLIEKRVGEL